MKTMIIIIAAIALCSCNSGPETAAKEIQENTSSTAPESKNQVEYHPNGAKKIEGLLKNGKRSGRWKSYYSTGYLWSEMEYKDGVRWGEVMSYHPNGMMQYQGRYYNDERTGVWSFYDTTGILTKRVNMDIDPKAADTLTSKD